MKYTDLIFDLYGTLVDIHTEENDLVWEKTAFFFGFHGAPFTTDNLRQAFQEELRRREAKAGQSYECFPDIPFEQIMSQLFRNRGVADEDGRLGFSAAQLFRICSLEYIYLYPGALEALARLRAKGCRLWLLSNAQRVFTAYELRLLGLGDQLDGIYISSDYLCRKPDAKFYQALMNEQGLKAENCMMIGNDRNTDIAGAKALGMATLYMHTALTPPDQAPADPNLSVGCGGPHYEYEGDNWAELIDIIETLLEEHK